MSDLLKNIPLPLAPVTAWLEEITAATYDGSPRLDRETNRPIWALGVSAKFVGHPRRVSLLVMVVAAEPPSVPIDSPIVLIEPTVTYWSNKSGRSGLTIRAREGK